VRWGATEVLTQHTVRERDRTARKRHRSSTESAATVDLLCIGFASALPISAVFGLGYRHDPMRSGAHPELRLQPSGFWACSRVEW
jgi:hypothetical protein